MDTCKPKEFGLNNKEFIMKKITTVAVSIAGVTAIFNLGIGNAFAASYTMAQIAPHNTATDCWEVINGNVYNLTDFLSQHSGGSSVIAAQCGKDATAAFNSGPHSGSTINALSGYLLGNITTVVVTPSVTPTPTSTPTPTPTPVLTPTPTPTPTSTVVRMHGEGAEHSKTKKHNKEVKHSKISRPTAIVAHVKNQDEGKDD